MGVCEYSSQLGPYLDDELNADQRTVLEAHLRACSDCDTELGELRGLSRLLAVAGGPILSSRAMGRLHGRIGELEDEQEQADRNARRILRFTRTMSGIAACLLIAGSIWLSRSGQAATPDSTKIIEVSSTGPWDQALQPTVEPTTAPSPDLTSPADDATDWMLRSLASSSSLSSPVGGNDAP